MTAVVFAESHASVSQKKTGSAAAAGSSSSSQSRARKAASEKQADGDDVGGCNPLWCRGEITAHTNLHNSRQSDGSCPSSQLLR